MESKAQAPDEIPTALPGSEDDNAREKLLLETTGTESDINSDEDEADLAGETVKPKKRRWQVMRTVAGFVVFAGLLAFAVSWFFRIGWFAESKAQPVSRNASKDAPTAPVTGEEKLKMALSMVAANQAKTIEPSVSRIDSKETNSTAGPEPGQNPVDDIPANSGTTGKAAPRQNEPTFALPPSVGTPAKNGNSSAAAKKETQGKTVSERDATVDARGRSLFFGITRKALEQLIPERRQESSVPSVSASDAVRTGMPFGTLLPVRLVGSIYTLRNSGGMVRMELTRPVEGKGYSYPAGTLLVGNVRGGESIRAFVTIIGLINPVSGELVKFSGELLGRDGSSGIEGKRRKLTSQWARFFSGLKETASSVLGSVGAIRSGGTVILSEPIRRGSESMSEDLSGAVLGNGKDNDTFTEVSAGANGYVLVTDLPVGSAMNAVNLKGEAAKK